MTIIVNATLYCVEVKQILTALYFLNLYDYNRLVTRGGAYASESALGRPLNLIRIMPAEESVMSKFTSKKLAFSAVCIALATVTANFTSFHLPFGGSITLFSMLLISLPGYWFGPYVGIFCGLAHGTIQLISNPYVIHPLQLILDYFLAFGALGLSGFFHNKKNGLIKGYTLGVVGRLFFSVISGIIFYTEYVGSFGGNLMAILTGVVYNLTYIVPEYVITLLIIHIPAVKNALSKIGKMANQTFS